MITPTLMSSRRRRCALAAIAVCLGSSIGSAGPAQATPQSGGWARNWGWRFMVSDRHQPESSAVMMPPVTVRPDRGSLPVSSRILPRKG